jgi:hypothetical protein
VPATNSSKSDFVITNSFTEGQNETFPALHGKTYSAFGLSITISAESNDSLVLSIVAHMTKLARALLALLVVYLSAFMIVGKAESEKLGNYVREDKSRDFSLAMAGLSVTAIALILALGYFYLIDLSQIILFFAISFGTFTVSWYIDKFQKEWNQNGFWSFQSNGLANTGIISLGCGLLEFFWSALPEYQLLTIFIGVTFGSFLVALMFVTGYDLVKRIKLWNAR